MTSVGVSSSSPILVSAAAALGLFCGMLLMIEAGHVLRLRRRSADLPGLAAMESAIFALLGLLLAFTFSGAMARYDTHRALIVEEANDIGTAYLRLDLLPVGSRAALQQDFREYASLRARSVSAVDSAPEETVSAEQASRLQTRIWEHSVAAAARDDANKDATKLLIPSLNAMIDIGSTRKHAFNMHPPMIIFALLFVLALASALLAGYGMSDRQRSWLHSLVFAAAMSITVYATLDIEYPRRGLVTLTARDQVFTELLQSMR